MHFMMLLSTVFDLSSELSASMFHRPVMVRLEVVVTLKTLKLFPGVPDRLHLNMKL